MITRLTGTIMANRFFILQLVYCPPIPSDTAQEFHLLSQPSTSSTSAWRSIPHAKLDRIAFVILR
jgi:hypothetical protein